MRCLLSYCGEKLLSWLNSMRYGLCVMMWMVLICNCVICWIVLSMLDLVVLWWGGVSRFCVVRCSVWVVVGESVSIGRMVEGGDWELF